MHTLKGSSQPTALAAAHEKIVIEEPSNNQKICIFLLQLGGPKDLQAIEPFLRNLFEDVLPLPGFLKKPLAAWIAKRRTPQVRPLYAEMGGGSPLLANTTKQQEALEAMLRQHGIDAHIFITMRYAPPRAQSALEEARRLLPKGPWFCLSLYPQYSFATAQSSLLELQELMTAQERQQCQSICAYPEDPLYIAALVQTIEVVLKDLEPQIRKKIHLVFSAHGLPMKLVKAGDPYPQHIHQTLQAVLKKLSAPYAYTLCYQSRVGPVKWLQPSTEQTLLKLAENGVEYILVVPLAFVSEHIETLHELDIQLKELALKSGVKTYLRARTVGSDPAYIEALGQFIIKRLTCKTEPCCGLYKKCPVLCWMPKNNGRSQSMPI